MKQNKNQVKNGREIQNQRFEAEKSQLTQATESTLGKINQLTKRIQSLAQDKAEPENERRQLKQGQQQSQVQGNPQESTGRPAQDDSQTLQPFMEPKENKSNLAKNNSSNNAQVNERRVHIRKPARPDDEARRKRRRINSEKPDIIAQSQKSAVQEREEEHEDETSSKELSVLC